MPYGVSIYGVSSYGQLELPLFERVGGLIRYSEPETTIALVRHDYPMPFSLLVTEYEAPFSVHRYGGHSINIAVERTEPTPTTMALIRTSPDVQLQLLRSSPETFDQILLVRNWSDFTKS